MKPGHSWRSWLAPGLLLIAAIATYGTRYAQPNSLYWDENYHIASAQKQIDGVMYMEAHPPLGKMLIALGELAVGGNRDLDTTRLLDRDHIENSHLPADYSYAGVRLPSVLAMLLSVLLLYGLLRRLTGSIWVAAVFAALLVFDNALVVHTRAAMLEGLQILFTLAALYLLAASVQSERPIALRDYLLLGLAIGLALSVKLNAAVLLLLPVALFAADQWRNLRERRVGTVLKRLASTVPTTLAAIAVVILMVFYVHIATGTRVEADRYYKATLEYRVHLRAGSTWTWDGFRVGLRDHLRYLAEYSRGVPRLDECKAGENGSRSWAWPWGGKSINYRWNRVVIDGTPKVSYTYLIGNPLIWLPVLFGIVLSLVLILGRAVYALPIREPRLFLWICLFTALYLGYMIAIAQVGRVMYLYHYLLPLLFGIVNLALIYRYLFADDLAPGRRHARINLGVYLVLVVAAFAHFAPLTYGVPLSFDEFAQRQWLDAWRLEPVR